MRPSRLRKRSDHECIERTIQREEGHYEVGVTKLS